MHMNAHMQYWDKDQELNLKVLQILLSLSLTKQQWDMSADLARKRSASLTLYALSFPTHITENMYRSHTHASMHT